MSTDYKLMFAFHGCMMVLFLVGGALSVNVELAIAAALLGLATLVSILHRRQAGWRWRGVGIKEVLSALFGVVLVVLFLGATTPLASPTNPRMLPWFLAGAGIGLFGLLTSLKLVRFSQAEFLADCTDQQEREAIADEGEVGWRRLLHWIYSALFLGVWLIFVAFFYLFGREMRDGSPAPTATQTMPLTNHGETVYIAAQAKQLIDVLQAASFTGIPAIMVLGAVLHFGFGVRVLGPKRNRERER
ncbi:MAG: hypothetical protein ABL871_12500 [Terricaulis sp.]